MKKITLALLLLSLTLSSEENCRPVSRKKKQVDGYTSRDGTALSMMGWGLIITVGIAAICSLVHTEKPPTTTGQ
jgi:hypothetical protein